MAQYPVDPDSVADTAREFVSLAPSFAPPRLGEVLAIHAEVRSRIEYLDEGRARGEAQHPAETLRCGRGNCSDQSVLVASLCESRDIPTRIISPVLPNYEGHLLTEARLGEADIQVVVDTLARAYEKLEPPATEFGVEIDDEDRLWVPVDSVMSRYVADIGQLVQQGLAKRENDEWWWGALTTDAGDGRFPNNGRIVRPTDEITRGST